MRAKKTEKHEFALFYHNFYEQLRWPENTQNITQVFGYLVVEEAFFIQRVTGILRLKIGETLTIFDIHWHGLCMLESVSKKQVRFSCQKLEKNSEYSPKVTLLLPLLKKEALEESLYAAVALGVTQVQLVTTEKSVRWQGQKEYERLVRVMIAAAEQSKNFRLSELYAPCTLEQALTRTYVQPGLVGGFVQKLYAQISGEPLAYYVKEAHDKKNKSHATSYVVLVGPEGDFTCAEEQVIKKSGFLGVTLTPTVLRSEHAAFLLLGLIRTLVGDRFKIEGF